MIWLLLFLAFAMVFIVRWFHVVSVANQGDHHGVRFRALGAHGSVSASARQQLAMI